MKVNVKELKGSKVEVSVVVPKEQFNLAIDKAFREEVKKVNVPGFRKGKVPRNIFEKRFGIEVLYEKAINFVITDTYGNALEESKVEPVAQPNFNIDFEKVSADTDFTYSFDIAVRPNIEIKGYKGVEIKNVSTEVTKEDITNTIDDMRKKHSTLVEKKAGKVEMKDVAVIDFEGSVDGVPFEGGKGENHPLEIGSGSFIPGFEEQLVGAKVGEEVIVKVKFPEEYHAEDLKGKDSEFKCMVNEIKTYEMPKLDDEFVKTLNIEGVETVEQLTTHIEEDMKVKKEQYAKNAMLDETIEKVTALAKIEVPEEMVDEEADRMLEDTKQRMKMQNIELDIYLQYMQKSMEEFKAELRKEAVKKVNYGLVISEIMKLEKIEATDEELEAEYEKVAKMYNMEVEKIKQMMGAHQGFKEDVALRKTTEFLVENAKKI